MVGDGRLDRVSAQVGTARLVLRPEGAVLPSPALRAAVATRDTGREVGTAAVRPDPTDPGTARLGVWVAVEERRRGYGTEVVGALCAYAFARGTARVELLAGVTDEAGLRLAVGAGFHREGQLRSALRDGARRVDAVLLARLPGDGPPVRALPDVGELTDGVVTVRPLRPGDEEPLLDERQDRETRRWATTARLWTPQDARAYIAATPAMWLAGSEARFAVLDAPTGTYAGSVGLRVTVPAFRIAEIGYCLRAGWRGRGLTARAVRLVSDWAFARAGLARLELGAAVGNIASQRVAERAGFRPEGVARLGLPAPTGGRTDEVRYGLLPGG